MLGRVKYGRSLLVCMAVVAFAFPAAAQDLPKTLVSGGYQGLHIPAELGQTDANVPAGWYLDVAREVWVQGPVVSIVGQVDGSYETEGNLHMFLAGLRFYPRREMKAVPFAHAFVGWGNGAETTLMAQVGGGVTWMATPKIGVRAGADYMRAFTDVVLLDSQAYVVHPFEDIGYNIFRFSAGVVMALGGM